MVRCAWWWWSRRRSSGGASSPVRTSGNTKTASKMRRSAVGRRWRRGEALAPRKPPETNDDCSACLSHGDEALKRSNKAAPEGSSDSIFVWPCLLLVVSRGVNKEIVKCVVGGVDVGGLHFSCRSGTQIHPISTMGINYDTTSASCLVEGSQSSCLWESPAFAVPSVDLEINCLRYCTGRKETVRGSLQRSTAAG